MIKKTQRKRAKAMLPEIKLLITERALAELEKKREPLAGELIEAIEKQFPKETPPALDTVIKRISEARNKARPLEKPWSMATSANRDYSIPHEATGDLLAIKKYCFLQHKKFTIRQAMWAARLRSAHAIQNTPGWQRASVLHYYASKYAFREQFFAGPDASLDTTDLDMRVALTPYEWSIARRVGLVEWPWDQAEEAEKESQSGPHPYRLVKRSPEDLRFKWLELETEYRISLGDLEPSSDEEDTVRTLLLEALETSDRWKNERDSKIADGPEVYRAKVKAQNDGWEALTAQVKAKVALANKPRRFDNWDEKEKLWNSSLLDQYPILKEYGVKLETEAKR